MSIGGVTGLSFQKNLTDTQKNLLEQKKTFSVFESKQEQSKTLADKLQSANQSYQQKGSIFQTENYKTNVVENGYNAKLVEQRWAEVNHDFEQNNTKRLNETCTSLENAVIQTGINVKNYESSISKTSNENTELDATIEANSKEIETMSKVLAAEELSKANEALAKGNYETSVKKGDSLNKDLSDLETSKESVNSKLEGYKSTKTNINNTISNLTSKKVSISSKKSSLSSQKTTLSFDIDSIQSSIGSLKAKKGNSAVVSNGKNSVNANQNVTVAVETTEVIANNNGAAAVIAEAANSTTTGNQTTTEVSQEVVSNETEQSSIDAEIESQILTLENELAAKVAQQSELEKQIAAQDDEAAKIDAEIASKQTEIASIPAKEDKEKSNLDAVEKKINDKKTEISKNEKETEKYEKTYNDATEAHNADSAKRNEVEDKYNSLVAQNKDLKAQKDSNDEGLQKLNGLKRYFGALLDGQGNAKAGAKADLEISETKETKAFETLKIKNKSVSSTKVSLFSQQNTEFKAKADLNSTKTEIESYTNIFSSLSKV